MSATASELEQLVTGAEIGRRIGMSKQRVHQLAAREDFPTPLGRVGNYVVWRWSEIEEWNATRRDPRQGLPAGTWGRPDPPKT